MDGRINSYKYCFDAPKILNAFQIHDRRQAAKFFMTSRKTPEIVYMRFEVARFPETGHRLCVDLILYDSFRRKIFIILGILFNGEGVLCFPSLFKGIADEGFAQYAAEIWREMLSRQPSNFELRQISTRDFPFDPRDLIFERILPGLRDYATVVHHINRYAFARDQLKPGRVLDCACGTGYGGSMVLNRHDIREYVGVDVSPVAVDIASRLVADERAGFIPKPLDKVDDGVYDTVISFETIEHVPDPHAFLRDLIEKMHPEGRLILSLPEETWHGSHLNVYHLSNWTHDRFHRMVSSFFERYKVYSQRLSLLGPDTFRASTIFDGLEDPRQVECFIAVCEKPKRGGISRVVIQRKMAMGDVIWTTPIVESVARSCPDHQVVVSTDHTEVFMGNPFVDILSTAQFQPQKNDIVVDLNWAHEKRRERHILEAYAEKTPFPLLTCRPCLYPSASAYQKVFDKIQRADLPFKEVEFLVAIHLAATSPHKTWPQMCWNTLLKALSCDPKIGFLWIGANKDWAPQDVDVPGAVLAKSVNFVRCSSLHETAAAIGLADVLICPDGGISHVAAAMGTPTVVLYSMANPMTRMSLDGGQVPIWVNAPCRGCLKDLPERAAPLCKFGHGRCMETISPEKVLATVNQILRHCVGGKWKRKYNLFKESWQSRDVLSSKTIESGYSALSINGTVKSFKKEEE